MEKQEHPEVSRSILMKIIPVMSRDQGAEAPHLVRGMKGDHERMIIVEKDIIEMTQKDHSETKIKVMRLFEIQAEVESGEIRAEKEMGIRTRIKMEIRSQMARIRQIVKRKEAANIKIKQPIAASNVENLDIFHKIVMQEYA